MFKSMNTQAKTATRITGKAKSRAVYEHFGINLPRTTWDQEYSGTGISYEEAMPGDLILYEGHVGIYIGNDQIVNAINPSKGIGIIPATCMSIKTVRRVV